MLLWVMEFPRYPSYRARLECRNHADYHWVWLSQVACLTGTTFSSISVSTKPACRWYDVSTTTLYNPYTSTQNIRRSTGSLTGSHGVGSVHQTCHHHRCDSVNPLPTHWRWVPQHADSVMVVSMRCHGYRCRWVSWQYLTTVTSSTQPDHDPDDLQVVLGKPSKYMFEIVQRRHPGIQPARTLMIGDR